VIQLVIDVGNTSTAVGLWSDGKVSSIRHIDGDIKESLAVASELLLKRRRVDAIAYASVVPARDRHWQAFGKRVKLPFVKIGAAHSLLKLDYPEPATIGADRLADAAGATARYGAPVLVMDFGTALTAAVITGDMVWRGGVIAPGFPLMRDYLFERTAKLPRMEIGGKLPKIGRSTEEAMRFGALVGYRGMVREIVAQLKKNFKCDFKLVATGGYATWVLKDAGMDFIIDRDLTLFGIGLMAKEALK
jgi:type III pantothenate kinase